MIRLAERNTWTHLALVITVIKAIKNIYQVDLPSSKSYIKPNFEDTMAPANKALLISLVARAAMLWPVFAIFSLFSVCRLAAQGTHDIGRSFFSKRILELERIAADFSLS